MSTIRFLGILCFAASLHAQYSSSAPGFSVSGEVRSHGDAGSNELLVELYDARSNAVIQSVTVNNGQFELDHVQAGSYSVRVVTARGENPIAQEYYQVEPGGQPLVLDLPERSGSKPISGIVALRDLEHPIPKKALQEAYAAQQFARANDLPKAIAKLEHAIRIDPAYRDAHVNLGVEYVRLGRSAEAKAEFEKALDIGPPAAPIYADLALTCMALHQNQDADSFAQKALQLDPGNSAAHLVLKNQLSH